VARPKASSFRTGFKLGAREAFGMPAAVMTAGFIGYGSLASDAGMPFAIAAMATMLLWALPGQLVMLEMMAVKATLLLTVFAVTMSAVRLLPMSVTLAALLRTPGVSRWGEYLAVHFVATTSWALGMRQFPALPAVQRAPWMMGFGVVCTLVALVCCALGYFAAGTLPREIRIGLVFLMPVYFVILLAGDIRTRAMAFSLLCGAIAGPAFYLISPEWSVVLGGLIGGTAAYLLQKRFKGGAV
jgi:predicted branched-subunit amino acid permease